MTKPKQPPPRRERIRAMLLQSARLPESKANLLATIEDIAITRRDLAAELPHWITRAREEGASWNEIAARLGTSRQNAQQRYGRG